MGAGGCRCGNSHTRCSVHEAPNRSGRRSADVSPAGGSIVVAAKACRGANALRPTRVRDRARPELPWPTSSSTPHKPAGVPSTHRTWSPLSAQARTSKGKLLQRPTRSRAKPSTANHQTVGSEVAETHQSTSLDDSSSRWGHRRGGAPTRRWRRVDALMRRPPPGVHTGIAHIFDFIWCERPEKADGLGCGETSNCG